MYPDHDRGYQSRPDRRNNNNNHRQGQGDHRDGQFGPNRQARRGTPLSELDPGLTEVSRKVIGCAIEVHMELGPGYDESVYLRALQVELEREGITYKPNFSFDVYFDEKVVGQAIADLWVADRFIVEVLARPGEIGSYERSSLRAQLRAADVELGLIINFGERRLKDGLVRVLNPDKLNAIKEGEEGEGDEVVYEEEPA
jgi:GxxExxY protein